MFKSFPHTKVFYTHQQEGSRQHFYNKVPREIQKEKNYIKILKHLKNSFNLKLILVFAPETKLNFVYRNIFCYSMYWKLSKSWLENNYIRSPTTGGEKMLCNILRMRKVIFFYQVLTKDSVTVSVDAVVYYRVSNATISVANVENAHHSTRLLAQTTLRNILGTKNLHEILSDREGISGSMQVGNIIPSLLSPDHSLSNISITLLEVCGMADYMTTI